MNDNQLLRYSRQLLLSNIDLQGQEALLGAKVIIIGMGGLGSPVALYLAAAGIGQLTLVDFDEVDLSNLQRQIIHTTFDIGKSKVTSAKESLLAINPEIIVNTINKKLTQKTLLKTIQKHDIVIDCSDNFATRFMINRCCVQAKKPLISGAAIQMEGQVTTFDLRNPANACYHCLYEEAGEEENTCSTTGILAPVVGIIGSIQATEALKLITQLPTLTNRLQILDATRMEWREMKLKKNPNCPVCRAL